MREVNIINMVVDLLNRSNTTINKLYRLVSDGRTIPSQAAFDRFKKSLIKSVKSKSERALELFPIIKYIENKRLTEQDYAEDEILFTFPTEERIAIASPIEVLEDVPSKEDYQQKIPWDWVDVNERESQLNKAVMNYYYLMKDIPSIEKAVLYWGKFIEQSWNIAPIEKDFFAEDIPQEVFALHQSDNLNALLPTELAQLDDPDLEDIFYKNFIEKKLLSYQLWGVEREIVEDINITQKDLHDKGPLFVLVDTSGSMRGITEVVSKALALTIVDILDRHYMNAVVIPFSMEAKSVDLYDSRNKLKTARKLLEKSYYGGSDLSKALDEVELVIAEKKYNKSNLVILSDFIFKNLDKTIIQKIYSLRDRSHAVHSVKISKKRFENGLEDHFSSNWAYIFDWKGIGDENSEDELIGQIVNANIKTNYLVDEIEPFGFLKKIKDHEFVKKEEEVIEQPVDELTDEDDELFLS